MKRAVTEEDAEYTTAVLSDIRRMAADIDADLPLRTAFVKAVMDIYWLDYLLKEQARH
jgi:hypothetical protein